MIKRTVDQIVMSHAIKYNTLSQLVNMRYANSKYSSCSEINIFIDITKICNNTTKEFSTTDHYGEDPLGLSAAILNLCAHYRYFFKKGLLTDTNIYLLYSTKLFPYNKIHCQDYSYGYNSVDNEYVLKNLDMLDIICPYIENVQFIRTEHEISLMINNILDFENKDIPNILITKDIVNWQIVNRNYAGNDICVFNPKKYNGEDLSYDVTAENLIVRLIEKRNIKPQPYYQNLHGFLYPLILAMSRLPERNLKGLISIPDVIKKLTNAITNWYILNGYNDPLVLDTQCIEKITGNDVTSFGISLRYKAIDMVSQYECFKNISINKYQGMVNLINPKGLQEIDNLCYKGKVDFLSLL